MAWNSGFTYREQLGAGAAGRTVLSHLAATHEHSTESEWRERIARGEVKLDGAPTGAESRPKAGQLLTWDRPPWDEPDVPLHYDLLHEDEALLAVGKPSGLPTVPGGGFLEGTLLSLVRRVAPEASPMHRLGRGTSGLVLFARTQGARAAVQAAWRDGGVRKLYRALATGEVAREPFVIDERIGPVPHALLGSVHARSPGGREARSLVRTVERRDGATLVEVEIPTGRPHQIRIHLAAAGHPLVGDPLYGPGGGPLPETRALPGDCGYHLHALSLELRHPSTGAPLRLRCEPPPLLSTEGEAAARPASTAV